MSLSIVILAAGQGKRMNSRSPKVLQPLAGRPLLRHVVSCSQEVGGDHMHIVYGHGGDRVRAAFDRDPLNWVLQSEQLGTGHAVAQALPQIDDDDRVLVLYGDVPLLSPATLRTLPETCPETDLGVLTVDLPDPFGYGRIVREDGAVVRSVEQKDATEGELAICEINTGVVCAPAHRLKRWVEQLGNDNAQNEYYLTDIIAMAVKDNVAVHGVKAASEAEVMGINDRIQLAAAERELQRQRVGQLMREGVSFADPARVDIRGALSCGKDVFIDVNAVFEGEVILGDGVHIESNNLLRDSRLGAETLVHSNCHIEGASTGANCEIGPFARLRPGAELAEDVKVGNFVEIKGSRIASGSKVNHLTYIGDAEVGRNVNVGAGTITCNYDGVNKHRTVIGDGAFIGSGVELVAPVTVGQQSVIGAGSTISKDTPADKLTISRSRQQTIDGWKRSKKIVPTKTPKEPS